MSHAAHLITLLEEMATALATLTGLKYVVGTGEKRQLAILSLADDATLADPASVIRLGAQQPLGWNITYRGGIQIMTRGSDPSATLQQAAVIFDAFLNSNRTPKRGVDLGATWRLISVNPTFPQTIGLDGQGRSLYSMNLQIIAGLRSAA